MDPQDQLKNLFQITNRLQKKQKKRHLMIYTFKRTYDLQIRKRKVTTVIEGYEGSDADFKILAKEIKTKLSVMDF
jgi:translation initiation factor 1